MNQQSSNASESVREESKEEQIDPEARPYAGAEGSMEWKSGCIANSHKSPSVACKPELLVGDLVWSKIPGHAWWPSMVSYEPNKAVYFQSSGKGKSCFKYHVQFFGDEPQRGWVSDKSMVRFQGKDSFMGSFNSTAAKKDKIPHSKQLRAWERALAQAEKALPLNRQQRKLCYVFKYSDEPVNQKGSKKSPDTQSRKKDKSPKKTTSAKPRITRRSSVLDKASNLPAFSIGDSQLEIAEKEKDCLKIQAPLATENMVCLRSKQGSILFEDKNCNLLSNMSKESFDLANLEKEYSHSPAPKSRSRRVGMREVEASKEQEKPNSFLIGDLDNSCIEKFQIPKDLKNSNKKVNTRKRQDELSKEEGKESSKKIKLELVDSKPTLGTFQKKILKNKQTQTPEKLKKKASKIVEDRSTTKRKAPMRKMGVTNQKKALAKKVSARSLIDNAKGVKKKNEKLQKLAGKVVKTLKVCSEKKIAKNSPGKGKRSTLKRTGKKKTNGIISPSKKTARKSAELVKTYLSTEDAFISDEVSVETALNQNNENVSEIANIGKPVVADSGKANGKTKKPTKKANTPERAPNNLNALFKETAEVEKNKTRKLGLKKQKQPKKLAYTSKARGTTAVSGQLKNRNLKKANRTALIDKIESQPCKPKKSTKTANKSTVTNKEKAACDYIICKALPVPEVDDLFPDHEAKADEQIDKVNEIESRRDVINGLDFEAEIPIEVDWNKSQNVNTDEHFEAHENVADSQADDSTLGQTLKELRNDLGSDDAENAIATRRSRAKSQRDLIDHVNDKQMTRSNCLTFNMNDDLIDNLLDIKSNKYISGYSKEEILKQSKSSYKEMETVEIAWSDKHSDDNNELEQLNHHTDISGCSGLDVERMFLIDNVKSHSVFEAEQQHDGSVLKPIEENTDSDQVKDLETTGIEETGEKISNQNELTSYSEEIQGSLELAAACNSTTDSTCGALFETAADQGGDCFHEDKHPETVVSIASGLNVRTTLQVPAGGCDRSVSTSPLNTPKELTPLCMLKPENHTDKQSMVSVSQDSIPTARDLINNTSSSGNDMENTTGTTIASQQVLALMSDESSPTNLPNVLIDDAANKGEVNQTPQYVDGEIGTRINEDMDGNALIADASVQNCPEGCDQLNDVPVTSEQCQSSKDAFASPQRDDYQDTDYSKKTTDATDTELVQAENETGKTLDIALEDQGCHSSEMQGLTDFVREAVSNQLEKQEVSISSNHACNSEQVSTESVTDVIKPSLGDPRESVGGIVASAGNDSSPNSSSSLLGSPNRRSIDSDLDQSNIVGSTSKRLRKRKTMSDFHVGLAFDAILSKRKRSPDSDKEAKANASKKRRQTIAAPIKIDLKEDTASGSLQEKLPEVVDEIHELLPCDGKEEMIKKRRGRPPKKSKKTESSSEPISVYPEQQTEQPLTDCQNTVEQELINSAHDSGVSAINEETDRDQDMMTKETSKQCSKKKAARSVHEIPEDRSLEKREKNTKQCGKTVKKSCKATKSDRQAVSTDSIETSSSDLCKRVSEGMLEKEPEAEYVGLPKKTRRKSKKNVSYCEMDLSELKSSITESDVLHSSLSLIDKDRILAELLSQDGLSGCDDVGSLLKPVRKKALTGKKRKHEANNPDTCLCDTMEYSDISADTREGTRKPVAKKGKKSNQTGISSPSKKKTKASDKQETDKKREYKKKKSVSEKNEASDSKLEGHSSVDESKKNSELRPTKKYVRNKSLKKKKPSRTVKEKGNPNIKSSASNVLDSLNSTNTLRQDGELSKVDSDSEVCGANMCSVASVDSGNSLQQTECLETSSNHSEQIDDASSISGKDSEECGKLKKESVCVVCELGDGLIFCNGVCLSSFHPDCLGLSTVPEKFFCDECLTGNHSCFLCKETGNLRRCNQTACGKFYHDECASKMPASKFENNKLNCPLHYCSTCSNEKDSSTSSKKKLMRCVRCPTAYHATNCLVAGCMMLNSTLMVCHKHFVPNKNKPHHAHYNVSWCFVCSSGGMLVCCESCPAAFHPGCVEDLDGVPEEAWQCDSCRNGKKPLYGDLVWVKYGFWRWWPAKICFPDEIPVRIQRLAHDVGEFPVMFFGSRDYCWLHSGRVFPYQDGDKGNKGNRSSGTHKIFQKALTEVEEAYKELKEIKDKLLEQRLAKQSRKPPPYRHIKANRYITAARTIMGPSELAHCECLPSAESPCGPGSECLNRMLQIECDKTCPAGDKCQNQRFQKCQHVDCVPMKTAGCGWGLKTRQDIKKGDFVIEYVGELIDEATCRKRINDYHDNGISDYYFLVIDKDCIIDAYPKGNQSRFMNHSCDPNCDTQKWTVNGEIRVGLFANKDIEATAELMFNYNLDTLGNEKKACRCGSKNCSGFLGLRPKTQNALALKEKKKSKTKKKKKKDKAQTIRHEDECFACGDGGELIMCDKLSCSKCYHLKCLTLSGMPRGKWDCPWHFCDVCGKRATFYCNLCPNSFCAAHSEGEIFQVSEGVYICDDHGDDDKSSINNSLAQNASSPSPAERITQSQEPIETECHSDTTQVK